jgi:PAS domain S-box-containing protein
MNDPTTQTADPALAAPARLAALRATGLLDAVRAGTLDGLTRVAARLLGVPVALASLVDDRHEWFAGMAGLTGPVAGERCLPIAQALGHHVVASRSPLVVEDAARHPLVRDSPARDALGVGAYLGVPLTSAEGETLGVLCAIDAAPRAWTEADRDGLADLARAADAELRARECDARFRLAMQASQEAVYLHDYATGRVTRDGAVEAIYGCAAADLPATSDGWLALVHAADRDRVAESWQGALAQGTGEWSCEYRMHHRDGRVVVVQDRARIVGDATGAPQRVAGSVSDVTPQRVAEAAARDGEARLRLALDAAGMVAWERDLATGRLRGGTLPPGGPETLPDYDAFLAAVHPEDRERVARANAEAVERCGEFTIEYRVWNAARGSRWHQSVGRALPGPDGRAARLVGVSLDVTERVQLEAQLRQAQKMEAVGRLAGGVAHDFNNLLTVIGGNLEFLRSDLLDALPPAHPSRGDADGIAHAAARARTLVLQLLTFSRQQPLRPQPLDVGQLVRRAEALLRRVIGEEIVLTVHVARGGPPAGGPVVARVDAAQLEQVLLNLAVNARDAMLTPRHGHPGGGGALDIDVDGVTIDAAHARPWEGVEAGRWVRLRVRDTGHGMDAETQAHAFEPFYTTKGVGAGTGLGLATVFGIVRQAGGALRVDSAPGRGTVLTILLPAADGDAEEVPGSPPALDAADDAAATVLLVEDEAPVRAAARRILERRGHAVLEARHGADALLVWAEHHARIDAVVTDLRMPELGGRALVARLHALRPGLPVVYMSGYADEGVVAARGPREAFVEKPFTGDVLIDALRRVRHASRTGSV